MNIKKKTILLVEDDQITAITGGKLLKKNGFDVVHAYTGEEAVEAAEKSPDIDLILMDINLGDGIDGTEAAEQMLSQREIPLVFLSSHTEPEIVDRTKTITNYGYVVKNTGEVVLIASIEMALKLFEAKMKIQNNINQQNTLVNILFELHSKMNLPFQELMDYAIESSLNLTCSQFAFGGLLNEDESVMTIHAWSSGAMKTCAVKASPIHFPIADSGVWGECVRQRQPVIINDYAGCGSKMGYPEGHVPILRFMSVPVFDGDRITAVGVVANSEFPYDVSDTQVLISLYQRLWEIVRRKKMEDQLRSDWDLLKKTQELARVGSWVLDLGSDTLEWSDETCKMLGFNPDENKADYETFLDTVHPDDRDSVHEAYISSVKNNSDGYEIEHRIIFRGTGGIRHLHEKCYHERDDKGNIIRSIGIVRDITETRNRINELKKSKELLENNADLTNALLDNTPALISIFDKSGRYLEASDKMAELFKLKRDEIKGRTFSELLPAEIVNEFMKTIEKLQHAPGPFIKKDIINLNDENRVFESRLFTIHKKGDSAELFGSIAIDITEQQKTEEALKNTLNLLNILIETIPVPIFHKDKDGRYTGFNRAFENFFGKTREELIGKSVFDINPPELAAIYHEKDVELFNKPGTQVYDSQVKNYSGDLKDVIFHKASIVDERGSVTGLVGAALDITERRRIEEELRESEERFKALHNASFGGIAIHDKGIILDCNQGLADISGYSEDELIGMDSLLLIAGRSRELVTNNILSGYEKPYEAFGVRKNGEEFPVRIEAKNIAYKGKDVRVVEFRDLTELRKTGLIDKAVLMLSEYSHYNSINSTLQKLLDTAEGFTGSAIGFYNFVDDAEENLTLTSWSSNTLNSICSAEGSGSHYPVSKAGVWADSIRERRPVIHNDYESLPLKKGLPEGHAPVTRQLVVPVMIKGKIKAVMGVGNKEQNYDDRDRAAVQRLADLTWHVIERKRLEEQIKHDLAEKDILMKEIIHRMKNNIASVEDMLLLQSSYVDNPDVESALKDAVSRVQGMRLVYEKLLLTGDYQNISLRDYISGLVSDVMNIFPEKKGVIVEQKIDDMQIDVKKIQSLGIIVNELITNAMKYAFNGRESGRIMLSISRSEDRLILSVHDNGAGLPKGFTIKKSSGLGLMLISMLAAQSDGSFRMKNDNGTLSIVELRLNRRSDSDIQPDAAEPAESSASEVKGPVIIVADDLTVNRIFLKANIVKLIPGAVVIEAPNGEEAVNLAEKLKPSMIFMDIQMPVLDGIEASVEIRKNINLSAADLPIIAYSADGSDADRERCLRAGMNDLIVKPLDPVKLKRVLDNYLKG